VCCGFGHSIAFNKNMLKRSLLLLIICLPLAVSGQVFPNQELDVDTTARDSVLDLYDPAKQIPPDTKHIFPEASFSHREEIRRSFAPKMEGLMYFDPMDSVYGTVQTLGQIGKPALISPYGLKLRHSAAPYWRNPIYGRYNVYVLNPETQAPYYDTKTNFVNIDYAQGARSLQILDGTLSRNITPEWNMTGHYKSRRSQSPYSGILNQHRVLAATTNLRSRNNRYQLFANWNYNELQDGVNGGMYRLERDIDFDSTTFFKAVETPLLSDAVHFQIHKAVYVDQIYHLFGHAKGDPMPQVDSLKKPGKKPPVYEDRTRQRLSLRFTSSLSGGYQRFTDAGIDTTRNQTGFIAAYPALADTNNLNHELRSDDLKLRGGASYSLVFPEKMYWNLQAYLGFQRLSMLVANSNLADTRTEQRVTSELYLPSLNLRQRFEGRRTSSTLFNGETYLYADLSLAPRLVNAAQDSISDDSTAFNGIITERPFQLAAAVSFYDQNPSVFQQYYPRTDYLTISGNPDLRNSQILHIHAGLTWESDRSVVLGDTIFSNILGLKAFLSRAGRMVYYTRQMEVEQADAGEGLTWFGVELNGRVRFLKKFYAEGNMRYQQGSTAATNDLAYYATHLPRFHSTIDVFYDNRNVEFAGSFRLGARLHFFTNYGGMGMDAFTGEFFPTDYTVKAYPRLDLYAMTQIKRAFLWARVIHANEFLLAPGYYEIPFYPALERTFTFGVNWSVYD